MDMNYREGNAGGRGWAGWSGVKGGNRTTVITYSINIFLKKKSIKNKNLIHKKKKARALK